VKKTPIPVVFDAIRFYFIASN